LSSDIIFILSLASEGIQLNWRKTERDFRLPPRVNEIWARSGFYVAWNGSLLGRLETT